MQGGMTWLRSGLKAGIAVFAMATLSACAETEFVIHSTKEIQDLQEPAKAQGHYKVGKPYQIAGKWYYPEEDFDYDETGIASWYGPNFHGKPTANGETFDMNLLTAAHQTLPLPSFARVTNLENGRSLVLRINDRGPFAKNRILDVSRRGAQLLGFENQGTAQVRIQILKDRSLAAKAQLLRPQQLAKEGTPITVASVPRTPVSAESLPPPGGAVSSEPAAKPAAVEVADARPAAVISPSPVLSKRPVTSKSVPGAGGPVRVASTDPSAGVAQLPTEQELTQTRVDPTQLFIQAGAFGNYQNALKTNSRLGTIGPSNISHVLVKGRDFYRVRLGPLTNVEEADRMLEAVSGLGFDDARIVVVEAGEAGAQVSPGSGLRPAR